MCSSDLPFGPVDNGTQQLFGLDYRMAAWRGDEEDPFHTEVGYWLWDAAAGQVMRCFMVPRGSTVLAGGDAAPGDTSFTMTATVGDEVYGILSNRYLAEKARTREYTCTVTVIDADTWSYEECTTYDHAIGGTIAPGTDVTDWTMSWGGAGGGMYATIEDLGRWAGTGLGTTFLPAELGARRLIAEPGPVGRYGLGIIDWGNGWIGHTGQVLGWEAVVAYDTRTGAAYAAIVNEGGSLLAGFAPAAAIFPSIVGAFLGG